MTDLGMMCNSTSRLRDKCVKCRYSQLQLAKQKWSVSITMHDVILTLHFLVYISSHAGYNETPCDYGLQRCGNMYHFACPLSFSESWKPQIYANFYITHLQLEKSCPGRTPDFIVTATRSFSVYNGTITLQVVTNTVNDSGGVSAFTVYTNLSSTDDSCLIVQISAENCAGISVPAEVAFRESICSVILYMLKHRMY